MDYKEEGIDCIFPQFTDILTRLKEPAINQVKRSFVDPITGNLIVLSDKIYFYEIDSLMTNAKSSDINLENFKKGNSINGNVDWDAKKGPKFEANPRSPGEYNSRSYSFMDKYKEKIKEEEIVGTLYRTSTIYSKDGVKDESPYHLFFMGTYLTIINLQKNINKSEKLLIKPHKYNRYTVCRSPDAVTGSARDGGQNPRGGLRNADQHDQVFHVRHDHECFLHR